MNKAIYLDMDGTIANLYGVKDWLPKLRSNDPSPYLDAEPIVNLDDLASQLRELKSAGYTVGIISWLSKFSSEQYKTLVRQAKRNWLKKIEFEFDEIHMIAYGTPKHKVAKIKKSILVDDDSTVTKSWTRAGGTAIDAKQDNWLTQLKLLA